MHRHHLVEDRNKEIPLDCKEIKPDNPKGNQPWIFIGRTDAETEAQILRSPDAKNQPMGKDLDAGKDWGREEKGATEDETVGWHHWLNRHVSEQTWEMVKDRKAWNAAVHGVTKSQTWLSDWTELNHYLNFKMIWSFCLGLKPELYYLLAK